MSRKLIKNGYVVTVNSGREVFSDGAVLVNAERIEGVRSSAAGLNECDFDEVINASGCRRSVAGEAGAHPRRKSSIWTGAQRCSSLYPAGPKYPSGHFSKLLASLENETRGKAERLNGGDCHD